MKKAKLANKYTPALNAVTGVYPTKPAKKRNAPANNYKIPATPKVSGKGWGY